MLRDYCLLADLARQIRGYICATRRIDSCLDLEPGQDHFLIALKGLSKNERPTITELAKQLQIHHHCAVRLVDGLESKGLIRRERSVRDRREVLVRFTPIGEELVRALAEAHLTTLSSCGPAMMAVVRGVCNKQGSLMGGRELRRLSNAAMKSQTRYSRYPE